MLKRFCFFLLFSAQIVHASEIDITSGEIVYDRKNGMLKLTGDVEAKYEQYQFNSKDIFYNESAKKIFADNESLLTTDTFKLISDQIVLSSDFAHADINKLHLKFIDYGSIFADSAEKENADFKLKDAYFTKCRICNNGTKVTPLWALSAKSAKYQDSNDNFYFKSTKFYIYDVPVLYLPYFVVSGNKVPKKTGFLEPEYSHDSIKGDSFIAPLFINIAPNFDLTYTPMFFRDYNINHELEVRHMNEVSETILDVSFFKSNQKFQDYLVDEGYTIYDKKKWRFILDSNYQFDYGSLNFDMHKSSGSDYLSRYLDDDRRYEESHIDFASKESALLVKYSYVSDFTDSGRSYYRLPNIDYSKIHKVDKYKLTSESEIDYDNVHLEDDTQRDRITFNNILSKSKIINSDIIDYGVTNRVDNYGVIEDDNNANRYQLGAFAKWRRNYVNQAKDAVITPIIYLSTSSILDDDEVLNYDAKANQLNFANLTQMNNAFGYDVLDETNKVAFELDYLKSSQSMKFEYKFGLQYSSDVSDDYDVGTGLENHLSDLMNNFLVSSGGISLNYFNRLAYDDLFPYYNSLTLSADFDKVVLATTVSHLEYSHLDSSYADDKNLSTYLLYKVTPNIDVMNKSSFDYTDQGLFSGSMTENQFGITYRNICFVAKFIVTSRFYNNSDVQDDTSINFSVDFFSAIK